MSNEILRKYIDIINEQMNLFEGIEEKYGGFTIKSYTRKDKGISVANVFDISGNFDPKNTKYFPAVTAPSDKEALELQKNAIDKFNAKRNQTFSLAKYHKAYPNGVLQSQLGLKDIIWMKVDQDKVVYISRKPQPGFIKSLPSDDYLIGNGVPIPTKELEKAGLEPGTRYHVKQFDTGNPDIIGLKLTEWRKILHTGDKDPGTTPSITIQMTGRNKLGEEEC